MYIYIIHIYILQSLQGEFTTTLHLGFPKTIQATGWKSSSCRLVTQHNSLASGASNQTAFFTPKNSRKDPKMMLQQRISGFNYRDLGVSGVSILACGCIIVGWKMDHFKIPISWSSLPQGSKALRIQEPNWPNRTHCLHCRHIHFEPINHRVFGHGNAPSQTNQLM